MASEGETKKALASSLASAEAAAAKAAAEAAAAKAAAEEEAVAAAAAEAASDEPEIYKIPDFDTQPESAESLPLDKPATEMSEAKKYMNALYYC